jgi:syntaxin-binding protein 5
MVLALHPRDIGTLLIGYAEGAVTYSFKQNKPTRFFQYQVPRGAPGGDGDPRAANTVRHPRLTHAVWHPTGTFILTGHEDGSLVFWDVKDGRVVLARTLTDTHVDKPGMGSVNPAGGAAQREPFFKLVWCANQDPEDTAVLVAGGSSISSPTKSLTLFELGRTPVYATSSWQVITAYLETPKRQRMLPIPPGTEVIDFCMIPRSSPHFAGAHDPLATVAVLASGEIITMSFPSGFPISPTNQLHVSVSFVHPFVNSINLSPVERGKWLGMVEKRDNGPQLLKGGAEAQRPLKRFEHRNIVQTAHADGTIRLWDAGHGDEIENEGVLQVDVDRAAGRPEGTDITKMSLSGASGELAVGTRAGDLLLFRWGKNRYAGREQQPGPAGRPGELVDISSRSDPTLTEGLLPLTMVAMQNGPVTCLKLSDVGFLAAGFEGGGVAVIDLRGPAIIYNSNVQEFAQASKRHVGRSERQPTRGDHATSMEFSVMTLEGESWSSILLHVGTSFGSVATFKVIPAGGRYTVQLAGVASHEGRIVRISPLSADSGYPAYATPQVVAALREGRKVNGVLLVVSEQGARISKPATSKGAHKTWDNFVVQSAAVSNCEDIGIALVTFSDDGIARAFSIPALREIGGARLSDKMDPRRAGEALITNSGDILGWCGPAEAALVNIWGRGLTLYVKWPGSLTAILTSIQKPI